ncbi:GNAT family N-acetyltransferase [Stackebrandtia soli]
MAADHFVGWGRRLDQRQFAAALAGSSAVEFAVEDGTVVGFVTAISDGVLTAFIPWLEVLPAYQGRGIGDELLRHVTAALSHMYSIDLVCDANLVDYYRRHGMIALSGMGLRHPEVLAEPPRAP